MATISLEAQSYIDRLAALNYDEPYFDREKVEKHILRHYELLNVACPEIVVADNMVAGFELATGAARDAAWGAAWDAAWDAARGAARDAAWDAAWDAARGAAWDAARGAARDAAWGAARGAARDAAWGAARGAARGIGHLNTGLTDPSTLKYVEIELELLEALESGLGFYFPMRDKIILVPVPRMIIADGDRLHYDHGKAVEWADHVGFYFLHGVRFEEDLYWRVVNQEITIEDMLKNIPNADQRSVALVMAEPEKLLKHMSAKLVSTGLKPTRAKQPTRLYEVPNFMDTGETEYAMTMACPSTDRPFLEWVQPEIGKQHDADLAQASAFGISKEQYMAIAPEDEA